MNHLEVLHAASRNRKYIDRKEAFIQRFRDHAPDELAPHRFTILAAQVAHECGGFRYAKEIWGPTKAQKGYEGRVDLGNVKRGDGKRFLGRGPIQTTGRDNYRRLGAWVKKVLGITVDFEANPDLLLDPKWFGIGALCYWVTRVPRRFVDTGNHEMVTRRINGGLNGYSDRLERYDEAALSTLGIMNVAAFQQKYDLTVDGVVGPQTRGAMHKALIELGKVSSRKPATRPSSGQSGGLFAAVVSAIGKALGRKRNG